MTITNEENGLYQVARIGLHGKLEIFVLQVDRGAEATQGSTHTQGCNKGTEQKENLLKDCPIWALNSYWVVQCYRGPRTRHFD